MGCKQHNACYDMWLSNPLDCRPDLAKLSEGGSTCVQCCDERSGQCNLDLYEKTAAESVASQKGNYLTIKMKHHELPERPDPAQYMPADYTLKTGEVVKENDSRAIAEKEAAAAAQNARRRR